MNKYLKAYVNAINDDGVNTKPFSKEQEDLLENTLNGCGTLNSTRTRVFGFINEMMCFLRALENNRGWQEMTAYVQLHIQYHVTDGGGRFAVACKRSNGKWYTTAGTFNSMSEKDDIPLEWEPLLFLSINELPTIKVDPA